MVTVSCLGGFGRFGNSLFQYAYARAYAESIGAELVIPEGWIGRQLFEGVKERVHHEATCYERTEDPQGRDNVDLYGYFQSDRHVKMLSRSKLKKWFAPKPQWKSPGHPLAVHKRRGDYAAAGCFALVSDISYEDGMKKFGYNPELAAVYSDDRSQDLIYSDFFQLAASRVLFRANSSFSFWAGVLCDGEVYSPVVEDRSGWIDCEFVKGNHPRLMYMFQDLHIAP